MILYILIVCFLQYEIRKSKENQEELEVYFSHYVFKWNKILATETEDSTPLNHNQPPNTILSPILPSLRLKTYCQKLQYNIIFRSILTEHISLISHVHHLFTKATT